MAQGECRLDLWHARRPTASAQLGRDDAEAGEDFRSRARLRRSAAVSLGAAESNQREGARERRDRRDDAVERRHRAAPASETRSLRYSNCARDCREMKLLVFLLIPALLSAQVAKFRVRESAGLRRFNIPVRTSIRTDASPLALHENGRPIPAQFTPRGDGTIEIDFNASHAPWEVREYRVERGAGPPVSNNMSIAQANGVFAVRSGLQYDVPENLIGL